MFFDGSFGVDEGTAFVLDVVEVEVVKGLVVAVLAGVDCVSSNVGRQRSRLLSSIVVFLLSLSLENGPPSPTHVLL